MNMAKQLVPQPKRVGEMLITEEVCSVSQKRFMKIEYFIDGEKAGERRTESLFSYLFLTESIEFFHAIRKRNEKGETDTPNTASTF